MAPMSAADRTILVINSGSSSVKFALFAAQTSLPRRWSGAIDRIGLAKGHFRAVDTDGVALIEEDADIPDHNAALRLVLDAVDSHVSGAPLAAVGHRVVHGGPDCARPLVVTSAVEEQLRRLIPLAPLHQPNSLAGIGAVRSARPGIT